MDFRYFWRKPWQFLKFSGWLEAELLRYPKMLMQSRLRVKTRLSWYCCIAWHWPNSRPLKFDDGTYKFLEDTIYRLLARLLSLFMPPPRTTKWGLLPSIWRYRWRSFKIMNIANTRLVNMCVGVTWCSWRCARVIYTEKGISQSMHVDAMTPVMFIFTRPLLYFLLLMKMSR